ncbi:MAG: hypothetical protein BWY00_01635 [Firmicutes bacterium ADurb.Bin153]|mgnify:FL=1|nr:MAG: hypothetical protein BWY00_01635 [Firmicutes bacterium ADurb.Bin153]
MGMEARGKAPSALDAVADFAKAFRMWYERIVLSFMFASAWWALGFVAAQLALVNPIMLVPATAIWAVAATASMCMANRTVHLEDFELGAFFKDLRRRLVRYAGLFALSAAAMLLYLPLVLYLPTLGSFVGYAGFGICAWVGLFSFITVCFAAGIIAERDESTFKAVKKGFLLMMDNPGYSLVCGILLLILAFVGYLLPMISMTWSSWAYLVLVMVGVFMYGSVNAYYVCFATRRLLRRYGLDRKSGREAIQEELAGK